MTFRQLVGRYTDAYITRFIRLLPRSRLLHLIAQRYIERYRNENNSDMHQNGEMHWLLSVLGDCKVVFDVGANIGDWTEIALKINPQLQMHCFEPSTASFQKLQ